MLANGRYRVAAVCVIRTDLDERQVTADVRLLRYHPHVDDVDQFEEIRGDQAGVSALDIDHDGHTGYMRLVRPSNSETVHVEVAPPKEAGNPVQDTGLVVDQRDQSLFVFHVILLPVWDVVSCHAGLRLPAPSDKPCPLFRLRTRSAQAL